MTRWEYKFTSPDKWDDHIAELNELGSYGWELVSVVPVGEIQPFQYFFKRPVEEESEK